jgi:hypothetical protein
MIDCIVSRKSRWVRPATALLVLLCFSGCALISSYDEKTDDGVTALQQKVETFFVTLESQEGSPECKYENHRSFHQEAKVAISAIEVRARAIPQNDITVEQVELLKDSLNKLEQLHKLDCLSSMQIAPLRSNFTSSFVAILKLEIAKKQP